MAKQEVIEAQKSSLAISPREKELYETMRQLEHNEDLKAILKYSKSEIPLTPIHWSLEQDLTIPTSREVIPNTPIEVILGHKISLIGRTDGEYLDFFQIYMASSGIGCQGQLVLAPKNKYNFDGVLQDDGTGFFYMEDDESRTKYIGGIFSELTSADIINKVVGFLKTNNANLTDKLEEAEKSQRELEQILRTGRKLEAQYRL